MHSKRSNGVTNGVKTTTHAKTSRHMEFKKSLEIKSNLISLCSELAKIISIKAVQISEMP
jgi:hypothetical protein